MPLSFFDNYQSGTTGIKGVGREVSMCRSGLPEAFVFEEVRLGYCVLSGTGACFFSKGRWIRGLGPFVPCAIGGDKDAFLIIY